MPDTSVSSVKHPYRYREYRYCTEHTLGMVRTRNVFTVFRFTLYHCIRQRHFIQYGCQVSGYISEKRRGRWMLINFVGLMPEEVGMTRISDGTCIFSHKFAWLYWRKPRSHHRRSFFFGVEAYILGVHMPGLVQGRRSVNAVKGSNRGLLAANLLLQGQGLHYSIYICTIASFPSPNRRRAHTVYRKQRGGQAMRDHSQEPPLLPSGTCLHFADALRSVQHSHCSSICIGIYYDLYCSACLVKLSSKLDHTLLPIYPDCNALQKNR